MSSAAKALVRSALLEVFGEGRLDRLDELYAPDVAAPVRAVVTQLREAFPDLSITIDTLVGDGDEVAAAWTAKGTHRGWFRGVPPTEQEMTWAGGAVFVIADGKIAMQRTSWDLYGLVQQLRAALA